MYRISYIWYSAIGCVIVLITGMIGSFLTGRQDPRCLNRNLISPVADSFVKRFCSSSLRRRINWDLGAYLVSFPVQAEICWKL